MKKKAHHQVRVKVKVKWMKKWTRIPRAHPRVKEERGAVHSQKVDMQNSRSHRQKLIMGTAKSLPTNWSGGAVDVYKDTRYKAKLHVPDPSSMS